MRRKAIWLLSILAFVALGSAQAEPPFGTDKDVKYSQTLWSALMDAGLVGDNRVMSTPYEGQHPHGAVLDTIETTLSVGGNTGEVIIKRNYGGEGVSKSAVANNPDEFLKSVTVMYRRDGFDPDNQDWFWVKYKPDGSLHTNPKDMKLAGAVAKGMNAGCIACHKGAPGGDYVFNHNKLK